MAGLRLPPGPRSAALWSFAYVRDPYRTMMNTTRRYGDLVTLPSFFGKFVITADPAGVKTVLSAHPDLYDAIGVQLVEPLLGESSVICVSGERHRALRKLMMPPFHAARMRSYGDLISRVADEYTARWPHDRPFPIHTTMMDLMMDVVLRGVFGLEEAGRRSAFRKAVPAMIEAMKHSFLFFRWLRVRLGGFSAWARFQRKRAQVAALFNEELRNRRADERLREDILSLLMAARYDDGSALSDAELLDQMVTLFVAGFEPTANSLAFALDHIHRQPAVKQRLIEELASLPPGPLDPDVVTRLPYLDAVISETLRLTPIQPLVGRLLRQGMTLQGYELPPGINVGIAISTVHQRPDLYAEPERFRPERFFERSFTPFEYLPFGGGARRCVGATLALYSMKLVLATVMRSRSLRPINRAPLRFRFKAIVGPRSEIQMQSDRRAPDGGARRPPSHDSAVTSSDGAINS